MVYEKLEDIDFDLESVARIPLPGNVLMTSPVHFQVRYVINPHMEGQIGNVDEARAQTQWLALADTYRGIGLDVDVLEGASGLPDMVFCANQTLPYYLPESRKRGVVLSRMESDRRKDEVAHYESYFASRGYDRITDLDQGKAAFEGMGDALWHADHFLLWGGFGFRTDRGAYDFLSRRLGVPVLALRLDDPDFYHLDTCLCVLDAKHALIYPEAFNQDGLELIRHFFSNVLEAPEEEARNLFACNAHCPDGRHVIIQRGCDETTRQLRAAGFEPIEVDTDEFLKSGGSVYCMKQMIW